MQPSSGPTVDRLEFIDRNSGSFMELSEVDWMALATLRRSGEVAPESLAKLLEMRFVQATHRGHAITGAGNEALTRHKLGLRPSVETDDEDAELEGEVVDPSADDHVDDGDDTDVPALDDEETDTR